MMQIHVRMVSYCRAAADLCLKMWKSQVVNLLDSRLSKQIPYRNLLCAISNRNCVRRAWPWRACLAMVRSSFLQFSIQGGPSGKNRFLIEICFARFLMEIASGLRGPGWPAWPWCEAVSSSFRLRVALRAIFDLASKSVLAILETCRFGSAACLAMVQNSLWI